MTEDMKLKEQIIDNLRNGIGIQQTILVFMEKQGQKYYSNHLMPGLIEGHWRSENSLTIYKEEYPEMRSKSIVIHLSKYGVRDKILFFSIDSIDENTMTHEEELEARIWADINEGIIGKTYR